MKILIVGSGGREHAIGWKLSQDSRVKKMYFAPGNGGTAAIGENVNLSVDSIDDLLAFAEKNNIDLTIVGPELPLTLGIADKFKAADRRIFGPSQHAAQLEGSKAFAKDFMRKHGIPTADYNVYTDAEEALRAAENAKYPLVVKADGIAAGKGVIICENYALARDALEGMMNAKRFGAAGNTVVIEEFMRGTEASVLCFTDGKTMKPMVAAQDYKRALDGDLGLNTGGMGSVSPAFAFTEAAESVFIKTVMNPTLAGIANMDYKGVLYFGLMINGSDVRVVEFNARFGDPETEAVLLRLKTPLLDIIEAVCAGELDKVDIEWSDNPAICVVAALDGYPGKYKTGLPIEIGDTDGVQVFHAGTALKDGKTVTSGGRVFAVSAMAESLDAARCAVYNALENITYEGIKYRRDL
ncbi:MAG: phosphoribosylamine--glycine ligase [Oscillospiraceae bacterium]|nr:phosphoribosylamine--glycine ligase [Oscillospiraceae bacterium]